MKKDGFVSTVVIYTFFILFLILMVFLLNSYSSTRFITNRYTYDIQEELYKLSNADINLYVYVWNSTDKEYKYASSIPTTGYSYQSNISYCKNGSSMSFSGGKITINTTKKEFCYAYFK